jgi:hypothetical protein
MRRGTEANRTPLTQATLELCILAGVPFHCHDGHENHLCRGFHDAFVAKLNRGDYENLPEWKKTLAHETLEMLDRYRFCVNGGHPFDVDAAMREILDKLVSSPSALGAGRGA